MSWGSVPVNTCVNEASGKVMAAVSKVGTAAAVVDR